MNTFLSTNQFGFPATPGIPNRAELNHPIFGTMKALIIYQDFASAMKANSTLQKLKLSPDTKIDWEVVTWRMEMLRFPPTATEALIAAADAHLVLFAGGMPESIPFWLLDWLREWAATRQIEAAAIAVTAAANGDAPFATAISALRQFATEHDLGFIVDPDIVARAARIDAPSDQAFRHWGINE
jgi:hypothetical protein